MFNILSVQENTNRKHNFTCTIMAKIKQMDKTSVGKDREKLETLCIAGRNARWCSLFRDSLAISQKVKLSIGI